MSHFPTWIWPGSCSGLDLTSLRVSCRDRRHWRNANLAAASGESGLTSMDSTTNEVEGTLEELREYRRSWFAALAAVF